MKNCPFTILLFFVGLTLCNCRGARKYSTAYIAKVENHFVITLRGKGTGHPAGPSDLFSPKTFEDSIELLIPASFDTIHFDNVKELYPLSTNTFDTLIFSKGYVLINNSSMTVDLYQTYPEYPPNDPLYWNGTYDLKWKK
jgi:hypothetical protein